MSDYRSLRLEREIYIKVPSCNECNSLASDELTETIWDRHDFVKKRLEKRHRSHLTAAVWENDELMRFGRYLRGIIADKNAKTVRILDRLDYSNGIQAFIDLYEVDDTLLR